MFLWLTANTERPQAKPRNDPLIFCGALVLYGTISAEFAFFTVRIWCFGAPWLSAHSGTSDDCLVFEHPGCVRSQSFDVAFGVR